MLLIPQREASLRWYPPEAHLCDPANREAGNSKVTTYGYYSVHMDFASWGGLLVHPLGRA